MKSILNKIARFSLALIIPAAFLVGCQEDLDEPQSAPPKREKLKKPAGQ